MKVSKRVASLGLNVSMSVFIGLSVYGFLKYSEDGFSVAQSTAPLTTVLFTVLIAASIAGICFFGHQIDLRNLTAYREEEARKSGETVTGKGPGKPARRK